MTDPERMSALLDLVDSARTEDRDRTAQLVVLGLAERAGRGHRPTTAGWNLLGESGRAFRLAEE